jgi:hypothetical protein
MEQLYKLVKQKSRITAKWHYSTFMIMLLLVIAFQPHAFAVPSITITYIPPYGDPNGVVRGTVSGINYANYYVAAYIQVDEVWWTKPTLASPQCSIRPNGTFACDITTGGCDRYATAVTAHLIPKNTDPLSCFPCTPPPKNLGAVAAATKYRPYPKLLTFSGYKWRLKKAPDCRLGPGPNYFSDAREDVWVDDNGLHLRIRRGADRWYSSEVVLQHALGYGTYIFQTKSRVDVLDPNMVLGLFTWDSKAYHPTHREMDVEFARWGDPSEFTNAQFVLQPCSQCPGCGRNCSRFRVNLTDRNKYMTMYMIWTPGSVEFRAYKGQYWNNPPAGALIHKWTRTGADVPSPGKANIRFNFWLLGGSAPRSGDGSEVTIENFLFRPLSAP